MGALALSGEGAKPKTTLKWFRRLGEDMIPLIILSMADMSATQGPDASAVERERHFRWAVDAVVGYYDTVADRMSAAPLVTGRDLMRMGLPPGPEIGRILRLVRESQDDGSLTNREEALEFARRLLQHP